VSLDADRTPSGNGTYPRIMVSLSPDLGETHIRTLDQIRALEAINGYRLDSTYVGPTVLRFARVMCSPQLHAGDRAPIVGAVWKIGLEFVYAWSVPASQVTVRPLADRAPDFRPVEEDQWIWGLSWPEADLLRAYCPRHHDKPLWIDRGLLLGEVEAISPGHPGR
jgi:hypothetical protein